MFLWKLQVAWYGQKEEEVWGSGGDETKYGGSSWFLRDLSAQVFELAFALIAVLRVKD